MDKTKYFVNDIDVLFNFGLRYVDDRGHVGISMVKVFT